MLTLGLCHNFPDPHPSPPPNLGPLDINFEVTKSCSDYRYVSLVVLRGIYLFLVLECAGGIGGPLAHHCGLKPNPEGMHARKHVHSPNTINQLRIPS